MDTNDYVLASFVYRVESFDVACKIQILKADDIHHQDKDTDFLFVTDDSFSVITLNHWTI